MIFEVKLDYLSIVCVCVRYLWVLKARVLNHCLSPAGIDKENVELSPTSSLCSSGRARHGSASQVQKQRSTGSFKRTSIKKIVWAHSETWLGIQEAALTILHKLFPFHVLQSKMVPA